jgi:hypothetical protein
MPSVKDPESFYSLLAPFVARIKALEPGSVLVVPAGWRTGVVMLVLHCDSIDYFSLAVVTAVDGISHHPMRTNPATGMPQHNSPLLLRRVPAARAQDSAVVVCHPRGVLLPGRAAHGRPLLQADPPLFQSPPRPLEPRSG